MYIKRKFHVPQRLRDQSKTSLSNDRSKIERNLNTY